MNNTVKLGLFVAIGIAAIAISIIMLGNWTFNGSRIFYTEFANVAGLTNKAKVKIAGVDIGFTRKIELRNSKARLKLAIDRDVVLYENARARIVSMGVIGTKYIEINPGDSTYPLLQPGATIAADSSGGGDILSQLSDGGMMNNLASAIKDLKNVMANIAQNNDKISESIANIEMFSRNLAQITTDNKDDLRETIASIKDVADKLNAILVNVSSGDGTMATLINDKQMGSDLKEAIASAKDTVNSLKDTLGLANTLQLQWDYRGRYSTRDHAFRNDVGITIMPNNSKFYYVGVANVADASRVADSEKDSVNKLEALLGFRFNKFEVYGGAIRGTGGFGASYSFFEPTYAPYRTLQIFANAYDFGRTDGGVRVDADLRVGLMKWLYAGVAVEDMAHKPDFTPYVKLEIKDNDLAKLFGIGSIAAVAAR